jgi:hypothetical protein
MASNKLNVIPLAALFTLPAALAVAQHVTLAERVELRGGKPVALLVRPDVMPMTIADLSKGSDFIVEASLVRLRSYMSDDKATVGTDYQIVPTQVVHSRILNARDTPGPQPVLVLTLPGGDIAVNGTQVTVTDVTRKRLNPRGRFLIFARKAAGENRFSVVGGSAGIFEVTSDNRVEPLHTRSDSDPEVHGVSIQEFTKRIQSALQGS